MSKILVTGGAGFIGSHLVERLLKDGHSVLVIDNLSMGRKENLPNHKNLEFQLVNILDNHSYSYEDIDIVFHLAALTRPRESMDNPEETYEVNVNGTLKVLEHCKDKKVKRIIFVSSATVYGFQDEYPFTETVILNPVSPYGLSKSMGELYCEFYERLYGMQINIIRPFNVYGLRQRSDGEYAAAIPQFINWLKKGKQPFMRGEGKQARDFVYVDDIVDLLILAGESKLFGKIFNGGSGVTTSIKDLYWMINRLMDKNVRPDIIDAVIESETHADISKAKILLGWEPKFTLEEGLLKTIQGIK
jgi:nucleoside-diphosphate-sugar epimerase